MVKSYLRFEHLRTFGIVASGTANAIWTPESNSTSRTNAGRAVVPANEEVLTWDIKKGELISRWRDPKCKSEVSAIVQSQTDNDIFAVGYNDGSIRLWDTKTSTVIISFNGHRSAVSTLCFDHSGTRLASGSKDANIIVWDLISEVGLYRLRGHKDQITKIVFLRGPEIKDDAMGANDAGWLVSTGKDTLIKLWDLSTQHCMETHVAHNGECWTMAVSPDERGCITAGNDGELKVWGIDTSSLASRSKGDTDCLIPRGALYRSTKDRATMVTFHPTSNFVASHGSDKNVEIWRIRTEDEVKKALKRKRKRKEEKAAKGAKPKPEEPTEEEPESLASAEVSDVFVSYVTLRTSGKVRSVDWATRGGSKASEAVKLLVACTNNTLEFYDIPKPSRKEGKKEAAEVPEYNKVYTVELPGHRTDIRSLSLSSDDRMLASASSGSLKIWNVKTSTCIRTFECGYALCCSFLPGDKIVVVGTKSGELELFDVTSSSIIETVAAHEGAIWSLQVHPDGKSLVTGSADKNVKFWNFEIVQEEIPGTKRTTPRLRLAHTRTLKVTDDVLSVRYSPNTKLLAIALLDNTVKVFFADTLKHLLNLYGHKLPVLSMDISSDSKLIATCSADKNVKIWGLDFGDCHKSFFAHQDSVMQVAFERNSHNFFSAGKDKLIKYWDGDKFENIMKMDGHFGEVWALAVGKVSEIIVSASHDKSIRVWEQGDDEIFLEEEREKELEELYESTLTTSLEAEGDANDGGATAAGKQTIETLMAGERLMEALDAGIADLALLREYAQAKATRPNLAPPARNPVFVALGNISAEKHVLTTAQRIKASHLQDALLVLPFEKVVSFLTFLDIWAQKEWHISLTCRILFFLLKTHHKQIVASKTMRTMLDSVRANLRAALRHQKDEMGFNLAAVKFVKSGVDQRGVSEYVDEEAFKMQEERATKKRGFATLA
ncbi:WD40 repeat-like protein [Morchella conica CCBAS932]|uniref:WD40 repeat-like protein n=1 Tax=Morchella conica CCBAS932 TaxID=1392247 RepID=A0A3N4L8S9_9PEZI|nr:WD40 repeat-like protein [Morchella conica CCBAS932]